MLMIKKVVHKVLRPKVLLWGGLLMAVAALGGWWYRYNQTPAVGTVHPPVSQEPQTKGVTTTHFKSVTIAFDYPTHYATVENKPVVAPTLELYSLNMHDAAQGSRRITVTVKQLVTASSLREDSAFTFRKLHPEQYASSEVTLHNQVVHRLAKKDGSEVSYFVPGDKAYAIVATTTTKPNESFEKEISEVMQSFVWVR